MCCLLKKANKRCFISLISSKAIVASIIETPMLSCQTAASSELVEVNKATPGGIWHRIASVIHVLVVVMHYGCTCMFEDLCVQLNAHAFISTEDSIL